MPRSPGRLAGRLAAAAAAALLGLGTAACGDDEQELAAPLPEVAPGPAEGLPEVERGASALATAVVPIADLLENASGCAGAVVRTTGTVTRVLGTRTVLLAGDETLAEGNRGLRVLLAAQLPDQPGKRADPAIGPGETITVTGVFQVLESLPVSQGGRDADFRGRPTLVATDVRAGGDEVAQNSRTGERNPCAFGLTEGLTAEESLAAAFGADLVPTGVGRGVPVADILENPGSCLDRVVATAGRITRILGPRTVVLAGDESRAEGEAGIAVLLAVRIPDVAGVDRDPALEVGDGLAVRGPLRVLEPVTGRDRSRGVPDFPGLPFLVAYEIERGGTEVQQLGDTGEGGGCERFALVRAPDFRVAVERVEPDVE